MPPLKILHVANLTTRIKGAGFYGVPFKLSHGLVRVGHNVLPFSDRDIARSATFLRSRKWGVRHANKALVRLAREFQPDVVLFGHADTIWPRTLDALRSERPQVKIAQWNVDPLFEDDNLRRLNNKIAHVDVTFVSTAGTQLAALAAGRHRVAFLPNPTDPSIERARCFEHPREALRHDLFFAVGNGTLPRHHAGVETCADEIAGRIRAALPALREEFPGALGSPCKFGKAYEQALTSSAMGLNVSRRNDVTLYSSDRIAHLMGSGVLTFTDRASGYDALFGNDELAFYASEEELIEKIRTYLADDAARRRVAEAGWRAYRAMFDSTRIASYMLDVLFDRIDPSQFRWAR